MNDDGSRNEAPMKQIDCDATGRPICCFDEAALKSLIGAIQMDPEKGKTVWSAATRWYGGFKSEAMIRGFRIGMDEPEVLGGTNTGPNMVEVVLGALGCCLTTGYAAVAQLRGIRLEGIEVWSEGDLDLRSFLGLANPEEVWPGYTHVRVKVRLLASTATNEELEKLHQDVVATCPVRSILRNPVDVLASLEIVRMDDQPPP